MYEIIHDIYDNLNINKNYENECRFILKKFKKYNNFSIKKCLDIGCGTGAHMSCLSKDINIGFGIDICKEMIEVASKKNITNIKFINASIENFEENEFDLITLLFQVVNHIHSLNQLINVFKSIYNKLNHGGILIFDVFNNVAMLLDKPKSEIRNINNKTIKIDSDFDILNSTLSIHYNYIDHENNKKLNYSLHETIWSVLILKKILTENKFEICEIKNNYTEKDINMNTYKLTFICKKI